MSQNGYGMYITLLKIPEILLGGLKSCKINHSTKNTEMLTKVCTYLLRVKYDEVAVEEIWYEKSCA